MLDKKSAIAQGIIPDPRDTDLATIEAKRTALAAAVRRLEAWKRYAMHSLGCSLCRMSFNTEPYPGLRCPPGQQLARDYGK